MNTNQDRIISKGNHPIDTDIDRDVADLRALLSQIDQHPAEPHPAYWQNFLPRVYQRLEAKNTRSRRGFGAFVWAPAVGAALVVIAAGTMFWPRSAGQHAGDDSASVRTTVATPAPKAASALYSAPGEGEGSESLMLSKSEVHLLNAVMSDNDEELFQAVADSN